MSVDPLLGPKHKKCIVTIIVGSEFASVCRYTECSEVWANSTDYFQVVGIILGQVTVGFLGDWLGRRWGMIQVCLLIHVSCEGLLTTRMQGVALTVEDKRACKAETQNSVFVLTLSQVGKVIIFERQILASFLARSFCFKFSTCQKTISNRL